METIPAKFRDIIIQIATPYSVGTGFYIQKSNLIITNEHVVRDNKELVISGKLFEDQLSKVIYVDSIYDLAFLEAPEPLKTVKSHLSNDQAYSIGDMVCSIGHPFGSEFCTNIGTILNANLEQYQISYYQHNATLNPGNSGGPLINKEGFIIGINTFVIKNGENFGFSLPSQKLIEILDQFSKSQKGPAIRCTSCREIIFESETLQRHCSYCGTPICFIQDIKEYEATGIHKTLEDILISMDYNMSLARKGPNNWEIKKGSAKINISYHEKTGLIVGDAYLCLLPEKINLDLFKYLLQQNHLLEGLSFSIKEHYIIISLLLYDQYLKPKSTSQMFKQLFESADYYDNILMDVYNAQHI